jgi:ketosteroid isomerase-like protein
VRHCRTVSRENVEFVEGLWRGAENLDREQLLAALPDLIKETCDPEIEWIEDPKRADGRVYRGHEGVLESWRRWLAQFSEYGFGFDLVIDCGDDVLVVSREEGRGAASGAAVSARNFIVLTFRDGKILRYREFYDEADALGAVGLSELPAD